MRVEVISTTTGRRKMLWRKPFCQLVWREGIDSFVDGPPDVLRESPEEARVDLANLECAVEEDFGGIHCRASLMKEEFVCFYRLTRFKVKILQRVTWKWDFIVQVLNH